MAFDPNAVAHCDLEFAGVDINAYEQPGNYQAYYNCIMAYEKDAGTHDPYEWDPAGSKNRQDKKELDRIRDKAWNFKNKNLILLKKGLAMAFVAYYWGIV